jgi:hypothetical protein
MFAHAGQLDHGGRLGRRRAGDARAWRCELRRRARPLSDLKNSKQKARSGFLRAGFAILSIAGDLPDMSIRFRMINKLRKIQRNGFDNLKPPWLIVV